MIIYATAFSYYLPVLQPWARLCLGGARDMIAAINIPHGGLPADPSVRYDGREVFAGRLPGVAYCIDTFEHCMIVVSEIKQRWGKQATKASRIVTRRLVVSLFLWSVAMVLVVIYILPSIVILLPVTACILLFEGPWFIVALAVIFCVCTFKKDAIVMAVAFIAVITPIVLMPISSISFQFYCKSF